MARPTKAEVRVRPENRCQGTSKSTGEQCLKSKGWGTAQEGEGNCKYHGGSTPKPTALAVIESDIDMSVERYRDDPDIFNLRTELGMLRVVRDDLFKNYSIATPLTREKNDATTAVLSAINATMRGVERFYNLLSKQNFAMTVGQAHALREQLISILTTQVDRLEQIVVYETPADIGEAFYAWRAETAARFRTELVIQQAPDESVSS